MTAVVAAKSRGWEIEDVEWMLATGETHPDMIAQRLGIGRHSLYQRLTRAGRDDLLDQLRPRPTRQERTA